MAKLTARDKVLSAAQELMTGRGYSATTVDSIVARAGVAKGSFYHAFKSKEDLAVAALEDYAATTWKVLAAGPYREQQDPAQRALGFIDYAIASADSLWARGSLLGSVAGEISAAHPGMNERISALFDRFEDKFVRLFTPALASRQVTAVSAKELAVHLMAVIEGSILTAQSHHDRQHLTAGLHHFRRYLALLLRDPTN
jgi:TetR/AcrR family transcriptional repressor of nem operon